jgi:hypothetical protein
MVFWHFRQNAFLGRMMFVYQRLTTSQTGNPVFFSEYTFLVLQKNVDKGQRKSPFFCCEILTVHSLEGERLYAQIFKLNEIECFVSYKFNGNTHAASRLEKICHIKKKRLSHEENLNNTIRAA